MTPEIKINDPIRQEAFEQLQFEQLQHKFQYDFQQLMAEKMRTAVRIFSAIMNEEFEAFVSAPCAESSTTWWDYRNSYYQRDLVTSIGKIEALNVPHTWGGFRTQVFEQYQRRQRVSRFGRRVHTAPL